MSNMKFDIVLVETPDVIAKKILKAMAEEFNDRMRNHLARIEARIRDVTMDFIKGTDTYRSLVGGELAGHLGLPSNRRQDMVDAIIRQIGDSIKIDYKPVKVFGKGFRGETKIQVLIKDFSDILGMGEAFVTTEKGESLPWLEWLLIKGDAIIVSEHDIRLVGGKGRSGLGVMVKNASGAWRIPPQHSGTRTDNWLTRALLVNQDQYLKIISNILRQELE